MSENKEYHDLKEKKFEIKDNYIIFSNYEKYEIDKKNKESLDKIILGFVDGEKIFEEIVIYETHCCNLYITDGISLLTNYGRIIHFDILGETIDEIICHENNFWIKMHHIDLILKREAIDFHDPEIINFFIKLIKNNTYTDKLN